MQTKSCRDVTAVGSLAIAVACLCPGVVRASTVARYTFDTMGRDYSIAGSPERAFDDSGNLLHFTANGPLGLVSLSSDVPAAAPYGSMSLRFVARQFFDTPITDLMSIGKTGQLSIEFWYKPLLTDTLRVMMSQDSGPNAWSLTQYPVPVNGAQGSLFEVFDNNGSVDRAQSQDRFLSASGAQWMHLAYTVDQAGTLRMYRNGVLKDTATGFGPFAASAHTLRLGANNPDGTFAGQFLMDDLRISNVALPSGGGSGVNELAWNTSLSKGITPTQRPADFGKQWVRSHPMMISAWGEPSNQQQFRDANFNTALSSRALTGTSGHYLGSFDSLNDQVRTAVQIGINAGVTGWLVRDEVPADKIASTAAVADYIRSVDPTSLVYVSLAGVNPTYVDNVLTTIKPDAFAYGFYPWHGTTNATDQLNFALDNMQVVRQKSIQYGIPAIGFIQTFDDLNNPPGPTSANYRLPSGSELRADLFTKLSAGFKGVSYFLFDLVNQPTRFEKALVDRNGVPLPLYSDAAQANLEVQRVGRSLRYLESTDWRYLSGGVSVAPTTVQAWSSAAGSGRLTALTINGAAVAQKDGLVGYYRDDANSEYFMVVNLWHGVGLSPAATSAQFTMTFANSVDQIFRLNRLSGEPERISLANHVLSLNLSGGTGDIFKFDNGFFAGIAVGDANLDDHVDSVDFNTLVAHFGASSSQWSSGDFNLDGRVDTVDFNYLSGNFGGAPAAPTSLGTIVPEPSATVAGMAMLLAASFVRRSSDSGDSKKS